MVNFCKEWTFCEMERRVTKKKTKRKGKGLKRIEKWK